MDGTLVQSERLKGKALSEACSYFGTEVNIDIYKAVMGESWEVVTNRFFEYGKINPDKIEFDKIFKEVYEKLIQDELELSNNIKQLLDNLKINNKKLGVVSSASLWMVGQILKKFNLINYFDVVVTKEDVKNHKPNPEAYLFALTKLLLPAPKVLVFEDSFAGIIAANKSGCDVIAYQHEFNKNHDFCLAEKVISDFDEIII